MKSEHATDPTHPDVATVAMTPVLSDWFRRVRQNQHIHYACANFFSRLNYLIGIPAFVLSFAVGTTIFAYFEREASGSAKIAIGLASLLAGVLGTLHTLLGFAERAEKHRMSSARYGAVRRRIELLAASATDPTRLQSGLTDITEELDAIAEVAPEVPKRIQQSTIASLTKRDLHVAEKHD